MVSAFASLAWWQMPLAIGGIVLAISGPSMAIAALKLQQRTLGPLLEGNGWAINGRIRINIPLGTSLTAAKKLPPGATLLGRRSLRGQGCEATPADLPDRRGAGRARSRWVVRTSGPREPSSACASACAEVVGGLAHRRLLWQEALLPAGRNVVLLFVTMTQLLLKPLRVMATGSAFLLFWFAGSILSWVVLPGVGLYYVRDRDRRTRTCRLVVSRGLRYFVDYMRTLRLIDFDGRDIEGQLPSGPFILTANHPTLIDVVLLLSVHPDLCVVVKPSECSTVPMSR